MKWNAKKAERIKDLLAQNGNNVSDACKSFQISRNTFYRWKIENPEWGAEIDEAKEVMLDNVETAIYTAALEKNITACIFILKCQGHKRGWVENSNLNLSVPQAVTVQILGQFSDPVTSEDDLPSE